MRADVGIGQLLSPSCVCKPPAVSQRRNRYGAIQTHPFSGEGLRSVERTCKHMQHPDACPRRKPSTSREALYPPSVWGIAAAGRPRATRRVCTLKEFSSAWGISESPLYAVGVKSPISSWVWWSSSSLCRSESTGSPLQGITCCGHGPIPDQCPSAGLHHNGPVRSGRHRARTIRTPAPR